MKLSSVLLWVVAGWGAILLATRAFGIVGAAVGVAVFGLASFLLLLWHGGTLR